MSTRLATFLLVEDDDDHAELVRIAFAKDRLRNELVRVADGEEALRYLRRDGEYQGAALPDVILLDLKLPKLGGHDVLKVIKEDEVLRRIPVVVLTTSLAERDKEMAYARHANSYLVKPLDFDQLKQMVCDLKMYWGVWNHTATRDEGRDD